MGYFSHISYSSSRLLHPLCDASTKTWHKVQFCFSASFFSSPRCTSILPQK